MESVGIGRAAGICTWESLSPRLVWGSLPWAVRANEGFLVTWLTESGAVWYHKGQARKKLKTLQKERGRKARRKEEKRLLWV